MYRIPRQTWKLYRLYIGMYFCAVPIVKHVLKRYAFIYFYQYWYLRYIILSEPRPQFSIWQERASTLTTECDGLAQSRRKLVNILSEIVRCSSRSDLCRTATARHKNARWGKDAFPPCCIRSKQYQLQFKLKFIVIITMLHPFETINLNKGLKADLESRFGRNDNSEDPKKWLLNWHSV